MILTLHSLKSFINCLNKERFLSESFTSCKTFYAEKMMSYGENDVIHATVQEETIYIEREMLMNMYIEYLPQRM